MQSIAEAFLESAWNDENSAREARDQRASQLEAAGYDCDCLNLWNVEGYRVYVVTAEPASLQRQPNSEERSHRNRGGGHSGGSRPVRRADHR